MASIPPFLPANRLYNLEQKEMSMTLHMATDMNKIYAIGIHYATDHGLALVAHREV